jgi:hypothetical protein
MSTSSLKRTVAQPQPPVITPSIRADRALSFLEERAANEITRSRRELAGWVADFASSASDAFEWSNNAFVNAAKEKVAVGILDLIKRSREAKDEYTSLTSLQILQRIRDYLRGEVVRGAKWPSHSTSVPSNEITSCLLAAKAHWFENFDNAIVGIEVVS